MVGLSIVLEGGQKGSGVSKNVPQVINKATLIVINKPSSSSSSSSSFLPSPSCPSQITHTSFHFSSHSSISSSSFGQPTFLDQCFLCKQKLLPGKDIYMYKGDRGFCSVDCRYRQIFMDEEGIVHKEKQKYRSSSPSASSDQGKGTRNRAGGFAYLDRREERERGERVLPVWNRYELVVFPFLPLVNFEKTLMSFVVFSCFLLRGRENPTRSNVKHLEQKPRWRTVVGFCDSWKGINGISFLCLTVAFMILFLGIFLYVYVFSLKVN